MSDKLALFGGAPVLSRSEYGMWPKVEREEREAVTRVLDRAILSGSFAPEATALEAEFAAFVNSKHAMLTHCGTSALQVALAAAGVGEGDEVVVPAYSFVATAIAVLLEGAVPVFVDVDARTGTMDPALVEDVITPRTKALMPVHVHGCPADLGALGAIAKKRRLKLVEDAAQAHGATFGGKPVGALFDGGGFSLQSSKNLSAGEGGLYVTNDVEQLELANRVRNFGQDLSLDDRDAYDTDAPLDGHRGLESLRMGSMFRGNELMAAFARAQLAKLGERTSDGQKNVERLSAGLRELPGVLPPHVPEGRTSVHHKVRVDFDLRAADVKCEAVVFRDLMIKALKAEGVEVVLWQSAPLSDQSLFSARAGYGRGFPFRGSDPKLLEKNYSARAYPVTRALLDGSIVLFSQSRPLIAQRAETVDRVGDAFRKVWAQRHTLVSRAA